MAGLGSRRFSLCVRVAVALCTLALGACGGDSTSPDDGSTVVLLDVSKTLAAGIDCNTGGFDAEFTGQTGTTVTITVTGSSNTQPQFTLYSPDFSTQLAGSSDAGAGKATLSVALNQSGVFHVSACDARAVGGSFKVTVTRRIF
jgi:ABC-type phosphate transport system substrate-binding protein